MESVQVEDYPASHDQPEHLYKASHLQVILKVGNPKGFF